MSNLILFSGEPLLFKSSFTPVYDFGFVGLAVNKVPDAQKLGKILFLSPGFTVL